MKKRLCGAGAVLGVLVTVGACRHRHRPRRRDREPHPLPLGPSNLPETRTTTTLQPGVTLTRIVRGNADDPALHWTVEVSIPGGDTSPDPDAPPTALKDRASADELAAELERDGFQARVEQVTTPRTADYAGGTLGWRVRIGTYDSQAAATSERARLRAAGHTGSAVYRLGRRDHGRGPWHVDVLTIDPRAFRGSLDASYGPDLENRETTSALAASADADHRGQRRLRPRPQGGRTGRPGRRGRVRRTPAQRTSGPDVPA